MRYQANLLFDPERSDRQQLLSDPLVIEQIAFRILKRVEPGLFA